MTIVASPQAGAPSATPGPLSRDFIWKDEAACAVLAADLARHIQGDLLRGDSLYIELHGTLGAGKTTFTRHLLRALGVQGRIKSPSYAVVEPHTLPGLDIHHFDFYRFNDPQEWEDAGFRDLFAAPGLKLAEWPEKAEGLLPAPDLRIHIEAATSDAQGSEPRRVRIQAMSPSGMHALTRLERTPDASAGAPVHG
ncbi:MAG: tRNA (adenosine(37)-N6)-threonylcarbamoyltransferase complex ATPase subunit type 1 TsaE [Aquabacterium sp.]